MSNTEGQEPPAGDPELARAAHAVKILQWALSTDSKHAMFVFEIAETPGQKFALTMPIDLLGPYNSVVAQARTAAAKRDMPTGMALLRQPKQYQVGHSADMRGSTVLIFDQHTPDETIFVVADVDAYGFAEAIKKDIAGRVAPMNLRKMELASNPAKLLLPQGFDPSRQQ